MFTIELKHSAKEGKGGREKRGETNRREKNKTLKANQSSHRHSKGSGHHFIFT